MVEVSAAESEISPAASTPRGSLESTIDASTVLRMSFTATDNCADTTPDAATPPTKLKISASERAESLTPTFGTTDSSGRTRSLEPALTVDSDISALIVLCMPL